MIQIGDKYYELKIIRKNNKNIYLRVKGNVLEVTCPKWVKKEEVVSFVLSKGNWINNKTTKKSNSKTNIGDYIYYLGKRYRFFCMKGKDEVKIVDDMIFVHCKNGDVEEAINVFYKLSRKKIKEIIETKQEKYLSIIEDYGYNLFPEYKIKLLKSAWGINYNKKNLIVMNERLIHFDETCIEAILWHELLHFVIPNHSKRFHEVLEYHMPKYNEILKTIF